MTRYILLYTNTGESMGQTPEAAKQIIDAWIAWFTSIGQSLVDPGAPVMPHVTAKKVMKDGVVTDGTDTKVTGYSIIQSDDKNMVLEWAKTCPNITTGGTVEVHELMKMDMQMK